MFKLIKSIEVPEYNGSAELYLHECGMEVLHIKNDSEELSGNFIFSTVSEDNTGVAHILEHTVLCGSERYPAKDPFCQIFLTSPNTYLNAMTFPDKTMYPFASPLKKDFDIIFDIYADAVFAPLLRRESFQQEGVRFCTDAIDGVVFNEMRGAYSSEDDIVGRYSVKKLFEGTPAAFDSGGDPRYIPDLTYEDYVARYKKWYSPKNCRLFLYGNLEASEYLNKIEERYIKGKDLTGEKLYAKSESYTVKNTEPTSDVQYCATKDSSTVLVNWLTTPSDDPFEILTLSVLTDILLGNPGAPLYKAITDSGLGEDLSPCSGMESDYPILTFSVGFTGAEKNSEKKIESFIIEQLQKFAEQGINPDQQKACLKRQQFKLQEIPGGEYPYGILVGLRASRYWLRGKDPVENINNRALFKRLETEFEKGRYFENWIQKNLLDNPRRCLLTVKEYPDYEAKLQAVLNEKYKVLRDNLGPEKSAVEKEKFETFINTEDSEEILNKIPRISKEDLPEKIPAFGLKKVYSEYADVVYLNTFTRGITYFNIAFDITCLDEEELELLPLLTRALQMCGTEKHSYSEVGILINMFTGRFSIVDSCGTKHDGKPAVYLVIRCSSITNDLEKAFALVREILVEAKLADTERIDASVTDLVTDWESEYLYAGNVYSSMFSTAQLSHIGNVGDIINGTKGYLATKKLMNADEKKLGEISAKLTQLRDRIVCQKKMIFEFCCDEADTGKVIEEVDKTIRSYPVGEKYEVASFYGTEFKPDFAHKFLSVSSGPAYNSISVTLPFDDEKSLVCATLAAAVFNNGYMIDNIRGKGGAYGAGCHVDLAEKTLLCYSYRDPNIDKTLDWYANAFRSTLTQKDIDYTVAAIIGKELKPFVPKSKCYESIRRYLYGLTDELYLERRKYLLSITLKDIQGVCDVIYDEIIKHSSKVTVCGKEMVKKDAADVLNLPI